MILHDLLEPSGGMSIKWPCRVSALMVGLLIGTTVLNVQSEVLQTPAARLDAAFPFDLQKTIDWTHCASPDMKTKAEGYLAEFGEVRTRQLAQLKGTGPIAPIVIMEGYARDARHIAYILTSNRLYQVSWWLKLRACDMENQESIIKSCPVNEEFVRVVEKEVADLKLKTKGMGNGGVIPSAEGLVFFSYKTDEAYRTLVCNPISRFGALPSELIPCQNLFVLFYERFYVDL